MRKIQYLEKETLESIRMKINDIITEMNCRCDEQTQDPERKEDKRCPLCKEKGQPESFCKAYHQIGSEKDPECEHEWATAENHPSKFCLKCLQNSWSF